MGMEAGTECLLLQPDLVQIRQELLKASAVLLMVSMGQFSPGVRKRLQLGWFCFRPGIELGRWKFS